MLDRVGSLEALKDFIGAFGYPMVVTRGRVVVAVNEPWLAILGYRREEVEGHPYLDFVPPEERSRIARRADLRATRPEAVPFTSMTSLALKANGRSTVVHVQPTVIPAS